MVELLNTVHFWTTQEDVIIKHTDYGSFKYYNKKDCTDSPLLQSKKEYCEQRGSLWTILNKRPQKLREKLKEFEEYLVHNKIVYYTWKDDVLTLLLSTGLIVTITVNSATGDLVNINFDKHLSAKLQVNIICDGVTIDNQIICICNDGHLFGIGGQWKDGWVLEGGPRRKLHYHNNWLAVWGKCSAEHPQPWSPLAKDHQRANLHLYWIGSGDPELLAYKKTDGEPLQVVVSKVLDKILIVVEQKVTQRGAVSVDISSFKLTNNNLKRIFVTSVPLQTHVSCTTLTDNEDRLLICCIDGSLALLDRIKGTTRTIKAPFIPTLAQWQSENALVAILNDRGQLQYYDTALNTVKSHILNEDFTSNVTTDLSIYFNTQFNIASIDWSSKDLIFSLEQGPIAVITHEKNSLSFKALIKRYLVLDKVDKAIKLLLSWKFDEESFYCLEKIVVYLMKKNLTEETAQHLQNALGFFHNSPILISSKLKHRYGSKVYYMSRRFFHQLVRAQMFETAFLLAVDLGHHDLFMDLHYVAVKLGETEMAAAARAQASSLLSRCSSEASDCSRSSCSQCSDTESSTSSTEHNHQSSNNVNQKNLPLKPNNIPPLPLNPDNCLATNFNQPHPTTYKPEQEKTVTNSPVLKYNKPNLSPRATYVKSPQVPSTFNKSATVLTPPPLPFATPNETPLPGYFPCNNAFSTNFQNLGINHTFFNPKSQTFAHKLQPQPPPLPVFVKNSDFDAAHMVNNELISTSKKPHPKVKFSDTVTAFIVPEIKRPPKPLPPPGNVTDPQRELAESLPLCHPNEEYLKDFSPVRKDENGDDSDGGGSSSGQTSKIKVVHFGVV